jgi:hypothetical protein
LAAGFLGRECRVGEEPGHGRRLRRRSLLALAALTLPAGCATVHRETAGAAPSGPGAPGGPGAPSAGSPSASGSPSGGPSATGEAARPSADATPSETPSPSASATRDEQDGTAGGAVPFRKGKLMLGSYLDLSGLSLSQSLALRRKQLGREQRIVHRFYPWDGYIPASEPDVGRNSILMVSWHGSGYDSINSGREDDNIASVARKLAGMKRPILLRWGWEMNGDWFAWDGSHNGQNAAGYVKAWRRIHGIFQKNRTTNVAWVWCPNWNNAPAASWNRFQNYYPGDEYVDWVGVDGYNFYGESPDTLFKGIIAAYGKSKPIIVCETAAVSDKAQWIGELGKWAGRTPELGALVWFDTDTQDDSDYNFRIDTDAGALKAYQAMVNSPRFGG